MTDFIGKYEGFIFDLDGTIYRGTHLIPNAEQTINTLKSLGKQLIFISNKTTGTIPEYFKQLTNWGLNISEDEIIISTLVISKYLSNNFRDSIFYAIGEDSFISEIESAGLKYSEIPDEIEVLIVTLDRTLNYEKLEIAARALEKGAKFFAANIDDTCPVDDGEVLDAGSTISALEKRTHRKLELHFGKPSKFMFDEIKSRMKTDLSKFLLTGDRLETDIAMGNIFGIDTALVSTGVQCFPNGLYGIMPTYRLNSIYDIIQKNT